MFGYGSDGGGFMPNALGNNNLQQWGQGSPGFVQGGGIGQSSWQQPAPFSYDQPTQGGGMHRPVMNRSWIRQPAPTPAASPQTNAPSPSGFMAGQVAPQPSPQPMPQPQVNSKPVADGFYSGNAGTGSVDALQKNKLGQQVGFASTPSLGGGASGGWGF